MRWSQVQFDSRKLRRIVRLSKKRCQFQTACFGSIREHIKNHCRLFPPAKSNFSRFCCSLNTNAMQLVLSMLVMMYGTGVFLFFPKRTDWFTTFFRYLTERNSKPSSNLVQYKFVVSIYETMSVYSLFSWNKTIFTCMSLPRKQIRSRKGYSGNITTKSHGEETILTAIDISSCR